MTEKIFEQEISQKIVIRTEAMRAVEKAILPGFCEEMKCDNTCPLWMNKDVNRVEYACTWLAFSSVLTDLKNAVASAKYRRDNHKPKEVI